MTPPNPSEAAREAALEEALRLAVREIFIRFGDKVDWARCDTRGWISVLMPKIQPVIQSAISQSIAEREQRIAGLQAVVDACRVELSAQRARREKAEKVIDWIIVRPQIYESSDAWDFSLEYRAQYPRVEKDHD